MEQDYLRNINRYAKIDKMDREIKENMIQALDGMFYESEEEAINMSKLYTGWIPTGTMFIVKDRCVETIQIK